MNQKKYDYVNRLVGCLWNGRLWIFKLGILVEYLTPLNKIQDSLMMDPSNEKYFHTTSPSLNINRCQCHKQSTNLLKQSGFFFLSIIDILLFLFPYAYLLQAYRISYNSYLILALMVVTCLNRNVTTDDKNTSNIPTIHHPK